MEIFTGGLSELLIELSGRIFMGLSEHFVRLSKLLVGLSVGYFDGVVRIFNVVIITSV